MNKRSDILQRCRHRDKLVLANNFCHKRAQQPLVNRRDNIPWVVRPHEARSTSSAVGVDRAEGPEVHLPAAIVQEEEVEETANNSRVSYSTSTSQQSSADLSTTKDSDASLPRSMRTKERVDYKQFF